MQTDEPAPQRAPEVDAATNASQALQPPYADESTSRGSVTFADHCLVLWDEHDISRSDGTTSAPSSVSSNPLDLPHGERRAVVPPGVPHRLQRGRPSIDLAL